MRQRCLSTHLIQGAMVNDLTVGQAFIPLDSDFNQINVK